MQKEGKKGKDSLGEGGQGSAQEKKRDYSRRQTFPHSQEGSMRKVGDVPTKYEKTALCNE